MPMWSVNRHCDAKHEIRHSIYKKTKTKLCYAKLPPLGDEWKQKMRKASNLFISMCTTPSNLCADKLGQVTQGGKERGYLYLYIHPIPC